MKSRKHLTIVICTGLAAVSFLLHPQISADGIDRGLKLCLRGILPSVFPFLILTNLWIRFFPMTGVGTIFPALFHLPAAASNAWLLGSLAGYPTGAKLISHLYETHQLTREEANQALLFCCNAGPAFTIGILGTVVLQSVSSGVQLYLIHLAASAFLGIVLRPKFPVKSQPACRSNVTTPFSVQFVSACRDSIGTTLQICGFLLFFSILSAHIHFHLPVFLRTYWPIAAGFLELTNGSYALLDFPGSTKHRFVLAALLLGWGGLCVHGQSVSLLPESLSAKHYLLGKLLHGFVSLAFACLTRDIFPALLPSTAMILFLFLVTKSSSGKNTANQI